MSHDRNIVFSKSFFCAVMIGSGLLVSILSYALVRPVFEERVNELGTNEARMELMYLGSLIGIGPLIATSVALLALLLARLTPTLVSASEQPKGGPKATTDNSGKAESKSPKSPKGQA
jgi:hypothetical protein